MQTGNALTSFESLKTEVTILKNENIFLKSQNMEIKQTLHELLESRKDLVNQINFLKDTLSKLLNDQSYLHTFCSDIQSEIKSLRYENADLKSKHSLLDLRFKRSQQSSNEYENLSSRGNKDHDTQRTLTIQSARLDTVSSEETSKEKGNSGTLEKLENLKKKMEVAFEETKEKKRQKRLLQNQGTVSKESPPEYAKSARLVSTLPLQELVSPYEGVSSKELRHSFLTEPSYQSLQRRHLSSPNVNEALMNIPRGQDLNILSKNSGQTWLGNEQFNTYGQYGNTGVQALNYSSMKNDIFSAERIDSALNSHKTALASHYQDGGFINSGIQAQINHPLHGFQDYMKPLPGQSNDISQSYKRTWIQDHNEQQYLHPQNLQVENLLIIIQIQQNRTNGYRMITLIKFPNPPKTIEKIIMEIIKENRSEQKPRKHKPIEEMKFKSEILKRQQSMKVLKRLLRRI